MWLSQSNLLSALWSPTASVPAPTPLAAIISMERYFISCCWLFSPQSPQRLWSNTFFKSPKRACGLAASAHHRLQTAADTHSAAAALIKKSAASKVSQSKSTALRSSSRFSGEAAVLIFPELRRRVGVGVWGRGGGQIRGGQSCIWLSDGGRSGLEMCRLRWACDTAEIVSLWWFNCSHTLIYFNSRSIQPWI